MEIMIAKYFLLDCGKWTQFRCNFYALMLLKLFFLSLSLTYLSFLRYLYLLESQCLPALEGRIVVAYHEHIYLGCNDTNKLFN